MSEVALDFLDPKACGRHISESKGGDISWAEQPGSLVEPLEAQGSNAADEEASGALERSRLGLGGGFQLEADIEVMS